MDLETLIFLGVGLVGAVAAGAHLYGWIPPRYKTQLAAIQSSTAAAIGAELRAVFTEQEAKLAEAAEQAEDAIDPLLPKLEELPVRIGSELEAALLRVAEKQEAKMAEAVKQAQEEGDAALRSADMSAVRSVGVDRQLQRKADKLIGSAILQAGQGVLAGLRLFAPGIADQIESLIEENPEGAMQLWELVQQRPSFQKYIAPRLRQYLGPQVVGENPDSGSVGGWLGR